MVKGLLGRKLGMTRIFTKEGYWIAVTLLEAGPCTVVQRKTVDRDGYDAVQVGFGDVKEKRCNKPMLGHFKRNGVTPKRLLKEFRVDPESPLKPGDTIAISDLFQVGDVVDVSGVSKGKGFQGVIKRHGFSGGPAAHGSMFHRAPGSIGSSADPSEVVKGKRLPGHMGDEKVTVQNLQVVDVDPEKNLLVVRGAVPGARGGMVIVQHSVKKGAK